MGFDFLLKFGISPDIYVYIFICNTEEGMKRVRERVGGAVLKVKHWKVEKGEQKHLRIAEERNWNVNKLGFFYFIFFIFLKNWKFVRWINEGG